MLAAACCGNMTGWFHSQHRIPPSRARSAISWLAWLRGYGLRVTGVASLNDSVGGSWLSVAASALASINVVN